MKFSICIPNYNYERYLGETIQSVINQTYQDFEILFSDNASTDRSVEIANSFNDPRIRIRVNACNVGYGGNLDRAARMADGDFMVLLSSDDLMRPDYLETYHNLYKSLGKEAAETVFTAAVDNIDSQGKQICVLGRPPRQVWLEKDRAPDLDAVARAPVYRVTGAELLRRSLLKMQNPFHFSATVYPRSIYESVEGYGGDRLYNPDKWFNYKLLGKCKHACFVDRPLSRYRTHQDNQNAQQDSSGALKMFVDEYLTTFQIDNQVLDRIGLTRTALEQAFIEYDIVGGAWGAIVRGQRSQARRVLDFGCAVYPQHARANWKMCVLATLGRLGPFGTWLAQQVDVRRRTA